ncbi:PREDICTED: DNA mismatch repair protein MLH3-like isoform X1 [Camelina sativa]|uniref:DNA mismatch repair protein MLH3-like isoform X1 n=1 Tax=Camelina sativa TaxID=90675 RepID=A0ABM0UVE4_CAMSA|nr:PREDICTED: DNA mismatch repair protein MLH3-like isoform X1 [Camelina sativa]
MKTIKPLPEGVRHSMRSGIIMFDMSRVVEELVFNSLDAGATKVSIFVGVVSCSVKVVDDGSGVSRDDLVLLGEIYATSKFHDLETANEVFGFRGEALASMSDISLLEIRTKAIGRPNGYRKVMKGSKCLHLGIDDDRKVSGTTVTVRDLFYNQPVRRKYMQSSPKKVLESIKKCVFRIALVHSNVSFSVLDIESDEELFQTNPSSPAFSLLMRDAGTEASNSLCKVNVTNGMLNVSGYVSGPGDSFKALQYIYINSRFISKGPIHKLLNNLAASFECTDDWKPTDGLQTGRRNRLQSNPGYILCITCPRHLYEFSFEPSKTHVEFKNWEPILAYIERIILANWKKDTSVEVCDGGADLLAKGDTLDLRLQEDWPEAMEPTKKKLKRSNDQAPCSFLLSPAAEVKINGDYMSEGKGEWSVQCEFDMNIENLKEQDTVAKFDCQTDSLPQSCDIDFPQVTDLLETSFVAGVTCSKQSLKRCQSSTTRNIDKDLRKDSDELYFQFGGYKDELSVSNFTGMHLLRGCSSRGSLTLKEPIRTHDERSGSVMPLILNNDRSNSLIGVLETREGGSQSDIFSDTLEFHGMTKTLDCSLGSSWQDTDWFTPQRTSYSRSVEEDFNIAPIDTAEFCSYEEENFWKKYLSSVNVGNSGAESFCLSSELSPMFSTPPSATKWKSDYEKGCQILEGSFRLERMPDPEYMFTAATNMRFDHEIIPQMDCRETNIDSFTDIPNFTQSDEKVCKSLWGHADNVGIEQFSIRKDKFSYRDFRQNNDGKQRSRRSRSAPPFHQDKKKFISLNCRSDTKSKNSDPSEPDDLECLTQPCNTSYMHPKPSIVDDVSYDHKQETEKRLISASDLKASADCRTVHSETQKDDGDKDFCSKEYVVPDKSTTKWRHNCSVSQVAKESHELHDQDRVLDICSGLLHLRSDESLVPESINRHSLQDAKVLQQVDKKYIPIIACGTVAIVDQHAADERIRLEELHKKVLAGKARSVTYLSADQELVLPEMGYQLLQSYSEQIRNWGWICNINVEGSTSFKKNMSIIQQKPTPITLNAVPCILGVNLSDVDLLEFLQQLADTDGSSTVPPSVLRVLNSKACRGAIMFGDSLLPSECSLIMEGLKQTSLCFQCAHGRPTTVPLVNLKALHKQIAKLGSRQLWHGFQRREVTLDRAKSRLDKAKS